MEVQIFGTKKCKDTQKALRFFKERRVKTHFVDLSQRAASQGELKRFAQKFGAEALLDREGKRFRERGLHVAHVPEARILPLLEDDPGLLRTPLLRAGSLLSLGWDEAEWRERLKQAAS
ncbi:MAG TPA: ArsC/Spx/MgsR family protein [Longimicrobiaceae bacterium]|nr:ArsC/Spx/MgsR family protein [Longimicrobiaceae bacterium]